MENFSGVENKELPVKDFSKEDVFDLDHSFGRIFKIIPDKLMKSLCLRWVWPVSKIYDKKKSSKYISHVLGHEGPNSLLSLLIKKNLATGLSSGSSQRMNEAIDQFSLNITLTQEGEKKYE